MLALNWIELSDQIVLPAAMPYVLAGMRIALALGLVLAVLSEMMAGNDGLGFLIVDMQRAFRVRQMYAWLVILAVVEVVGTLLPSDDPSTSPNAGTNTWLPVSRL